jgi:hypothetical protein
VYIKFDSSLYSPLSAHVLDDQVGRAEVHKSFASIYVAKILLQQRNQLILSRLFVDQLLVCLNDLETLVEGHFSILANHIGRKLTQVA